ncbi:MAG: UvrD-helicase domain-containing protein [Deltaproteobacteria bacterium]|jgi:ATP-dependent exoDNAse (exonuclease V) beta subunit|nr:UvrD-helicase domain-containing protein [Deltaproteobacteria bacterium]
MAKDIEHSKDESQEAVYNCASNFCLVAGAGSGKTTTLVEYLLRYLAAKPEERSFANILAITFTDKAATEMRERINHGLWKRLAEATREEGQKNRPFWEREIRSFSQAFIGTIHSYALSLVRDYAFCLGLSSDVAVGEDRANDDLNDVILDSLAAREPWLIELLARLPWRSYYREPSIEKHLTTIMNRLSSWGLDGLKRPDYPDPPPSMPELVKTFKSCQDTLAQSLIDAPQPKYPWFEELANHTILSELTTARQNPKFLAEVLKSRYAKIVDPDFKTDRPQTKILRALYKPVVKAANDILEILSDQLIQPSLEAHLTIASTLMDRVRAKRFSRGEVNFDDILLLARRLLRERALVRNREKRRWSLILVDEFQDTNRLQADIIALILANEEGLETSSIDWNSLDWGALPPSLRVFGDSKQAIYRFRGAESRIMNDLAANLPENGGQFLSLGVNYRTQAGLVDFFNDFFATSLTEEIFTKQKSIRDDLYTDPHVAWLTTAYTDRADLVKWKIVQAQLLVNYLGLLFNGKAGVRVRDKKDPNLSRLPEAGDVALLFRKRKHVDKFEAALDRAGIPYRALKGVGLAGYPEIRGLVAFGLYLLGWAPDFYLYSLLSSPLGLISDKTLDLLTWPAEQFKPLQSYFVEARPPFPSQAPADELVFLRDIRELLLALKPLAFRRPPGELLETVLEARDLLPLMVSPTGGQERVNQTQKFLGLVKALPYHDFRFPLSPADVLHDLWQNQNKPKDDSELQEDDIARNVINIMTVHQAKGLEFPVTIIPEADMNIRSNSSSLLIDDSGHLALSYMNLDGVKEKTLPFKDILDADNTADLLEHKRLLYVAATRAQDHLVFIGKKVPTEDKHSWLDILRSSQKLSRAQQEPSQAQSQDKKQAKKSKSAKSQDIQESSPVISQVKMWDFSLKDESETYKGSIESPSSRLVAEPESLGERSEDNFDETLLGPLTKDPTLFISTLQYCQILVQNEALTPSTMGEVIEDGHLFRAELFDGRPERSLDSKAFGPVGPTSARFRGIIFHALLEETDYDWDLAKYLEQVAIQGKRLNLALSSDEASFLAARALAFQESPLGQEAKKVFQAGQTLWREKSFWLRLDDVALGGQYQHVKTVFLNGIMDLFFIRSDGRGQLVDYKLAKPNQSPIYQKQMEIYQRAIKEAGFLKEVLGELWFAGVEEAEPLV